LEFGVWSVGVQGLKFVVLEFGVRGIGFGVKDSGFGVWDVGFEIWGSGFGVRRFGV